MTQKDLNNTYDCEICLFNKAIAFCDNCGQLICESCTYVSSGLECVDCKLIQLEEFNKPEEV